VRYRNSIKWADAACENSTLDTWVGPSCNPSNGLNGTRLSAMIDLKWSTFGDQRYETLTKLRRNISKITATATLMPGAATGKMMDGSVGSSALPVAFPFSFNFLYWEEMGIIDEELWRNLAICGGVILCMVLLMIWIPRVSVFVVLAIFMSIVDVVGFLHWWGVTISGTSTIYILISVGLAVDYSAHVAHMFKESTGTANERAEKALGRIGPSVFHAVVSTFLAVVTMAASESYIFRIFFKALFLVTVIAGAHGLWFLPVILSVFGGANRAGEHGPSGKGEPADLCGSKPVKPSAVVDPAAAKAAEAGGPVVAASVSDTDVVVAKASNAAVEEV